MTKIQLGLPRNDEESLLVWLQDREILHVTEVEADKSAEHSYDFTLAQIQFALEFIERIRKNLGIEKKKSLKDMFAGKPISTLEGLEQVLNRFDHDKVVNDIREINDKLTSIDVEEREIAEAIKTVKPWSALKVTGNELGGTKNATHALVTVNLKEELLVKKLLQEIPTLALLEVGRELEKKRGTVYLEVVVHRSEMKEFKEVLSSTNAELVSLEVKEEQTLADYYKELESSLKNLAKERTELLKESKSFLNLEHDFLLAYDGILHRQERTGVANRGKKLSLAVVFEGWIPTDLLEVTKDDLKKDFPYVAIEVIATNKEEVPPVALKNSNLIEPFEAVTDIYGKPKYHELDPTSSLSIFFLIAFGLALTDAGYGIVMMLGMWAAQKFFNLKRDMKKMVRLLFYAGLSTLIFGSLTGGWFGLTLEELPKNDITNLLLTLKVIDPISSPIALLMVAFAVGIVQLLFAWAVRGYDHYRQKEFTAMMFDDVAWITMVVTLLVWAGASNGMLPENLAHPFKITLLANTAILVLTQGREHKNPLLKLGAGTMSLYGLIGFLSDMLSYSRLLALGLATGIIALVVNMISVMAYESLPYVGWILAVLVLIGGHVFNLGINALGAFIHSGRLQFVEFFPKFMEGGGVTYRPFGRTSKYVDNPKDFV